MFPTPNPLAAAFSGVALPQMVIVRNGRIVPISDVPKPQGDNGVILYITEAEDMASRKFIKRMKKRRK